MPSGRAQTQQHNSTKESAPIHPANAASRLVLRTQAGCKENHMSAQPFTIQIDDDVLSDLQQRLQRTRWPDEIAGAGWDYGTDLAYLQQLVPSCRQPYDCLAQHPPPTPFPQSTTPIT